MTRYFVWDEREGGYFEIGEEGYRLRREKQLETLVVDDGQQPVDGVGQVDGVVRFEEGEEERLDVVVLLSELLHEVRQLRKELAEAWGTRKQVIELKGVGPETVGPLLEMMREMGWG